MPRIIINEARCKGCGLCKSVCPKNIIEMSADKLNAKGYYPATVVDMDKCIGCMSCARMCPDTVIEVEK